MSNAIGQAFKRKAAENYGAARQLSKTAPNAAATRAYYALYLAVVGELEEKQFKPERIDPIANAGIEDERTRWRHSVIRNNGGLVGLTGRESSILNRAYELRIDADYKSKSVNPATVEEILNEIPGILEGLGVEIA